MSSNQYLHRQCPICQKSIPYIFEIASEKKGEDLNYEELVPSWNGFFKEKIFFSYARCENCQLLFAPIFYRPEQLEALYGQMPPNMDVVPMAALIKTQKGYFDTLKRFSKLDHGYIEVGPDIGIFTENCRKQGNFGSYWLCEPNTLVAEALARTVSGKPFKIIEEMFGFGVIPNQTASVAVMIQVLDHLLDPVATLPDAKLLLVTHNEQSLLRKIVGWRWPAFCLQHPQIYSPHSIKALLEKAGYEVNTIERTKNYFEFSFLLKHLLWAFGIKVKSVPKCFDFTIGLRLGNMITIATPRSL